MKASDNEETLEERAAEWLVQRDAGFSVEERAAFERWLAADHRHAAVFSEMEAALKMVARPREMGVADAAIDDLAAWERAQRRRKRRNVATFSTLALAAAAAVMVAFLSDGEGSRSSLSAPVPARVAIWPERQTLSDGSVVELAADAKIHVDFSATKRGVRLHRGAAHFAVAKDAARPFVVTVGNVEVRAVGTEFAVRMEPREIGVLVTEGSVSVGPAVVAAAVDTRRPFSLEPILVAAGTKITVSADAASSAPPRVSQVTPAEVDSALAWRGTRFEFTGTALAEAVALFNRKSRIRISLADATLGDLRVSGIYWADNPEGFAKLLESSLDIEAVQEAPGRIVLRRP